MPASRIAAAFLALSFAVFSALLFFPLFTHALGTDADKQCPQETAKQDYKRKDVIYPNTYKVNRGGIQTITVTSLYHKECNDVTSGKLSVKGKCEAANVCGGKKCLTPSGTYENCKTSDVKVDQSKNQTGDGKVPPVTAPPSISDMGDVTGGQPPALAPGTSVLDSLASPTEFGEPPKEGPAARVLSTMEDLLPPQSHEPAPAATPPGAAPVATPPAQPGFFKNLWDGAKSFLSPEPPPAPAPEPSTMAGSLPPSNTTGFEGSPAAGEIPVAPEAPAKPSEPVVSTPLSTRLAESVGLSAAQAGGQLAADKSRLTDVERELCGGPCQSTPPTGSELAAERDVLNKYIRDNEAKANELSTLQSYLQNNQNPDGLAKALTTRIDDRSPVDKALLSQYQQWANSKTSLDLAVALQQEQSLRVQTLREDLDAATTPQQVRALQRQIGLLDDTTVQAEIQNRTAEMQKAEANINQLRTGVLPTAQQGTNIDPALQRLVDKYANPGLTQTISDVGHRLANSFFDLPPNTRCVTCPLWGVAANIVVGTYDAALNVADTLSGGVLNIATISHQVSGLTKSPLDNGATFFNDTLAVVSVPNRFSNAAFGLLAEGVNAARSADAIADLAMSIRGPLSVGPVPEVAPGFGSRARSTRDFDLGPSEYRDISGEVPRLPSPAVEILETRPVVRTPEPPSAPQTPSPLSILPEARGVVAVRPPAEPIVPAASTPTFTPTAEQMANLTRPLKTAEVPVTSAEVAVMRDYNNAIETYTAAQAKVEAGIYKPDTFIVNSARDQLRTASRALEGAGLMTRLAPFEDGALGVDSVYRARTGEELGRRSAPIASEGPYQILGEQPLPSRTVPASESSPRPSPFSPSGTPSPFVSAPERVATAPSLRASPSRAPTLLAERPTFFNFLSDIFIPPAPLPAARPLATLSAAENQAIGFYGSTSGTLADLAAKGVSPSTPLYRSYSRQLTSARIDLEAAGLEIDPTTGAIYKGDDVVAVQKPVVFPGDSPYAVVAPVLDDVSPAPLIPVTREPLADITPPIAAAPASPPVASWKPFTTAPELLRVVAVCATCLFDPTALFISGAQARSLPINVSPTASTNVTPPPTRAPVVAIVPLGNPMRGAASTYNPNAPGYMTGGQALSTGGRYNPKAYEAALQLDLAKKFRCGYVKTCFALVEVGKKSLILKINDNGPLVPGRIIDLNEASMRYLSNGKLGNNSGVLGDVKVTLLYGNTYATGPVVGPPTAVATAPVPVAPPAVVAPAPAPVKVAEAPVAPQAPPVVTAEPNQIAGLRTTRESLKLELAALTPNTTVAAVVEPLPPEIVPEAPVPASVAVAALPTTQWKPEIARSVAVSTPPEFSAVSGVPAAVVAPAPAPVKVAEAPVAPAPTLQAPARPSLVVAAESNPKVATLKEKITGVGRELQAAEKAVQTLGGQLASINGAAATVARSPAVARALLSKPQVTVEESTASARATLAQVGRLTSAANTLASLPTTLLADAARLRSQIGTIQENVQKVQADLASAAGYATYTIPQSYRPGIQQGTDEMAALTKTLAQTARAVVNSSLGKAQNQIAGLRTTRDSLKLELAALTPNTTVAAVVEPLPPEIVPEAPVPASDAVAALPTTQWKPEIARSVAVSTLPEFSAVSGVPAAVVAPAPAPAPAQTQPVVSAGPWAQPQTPGLLPQTFAAYTPLAPFSTSQGPNAALRPRKPRVQEGSAGAQPASPPAPKAAEIPPAPTEVSVPSWYEGWVKFAEETKDSVLTALGQPVQTPAVVLNPVPLQPQALSPTPAQPVALGPVQEIPVGRTPQEQVQDLIRGLRGTFADPTNPAVPAIDSALTGSNAAFPDNVTAKPLTRTELKQLFDGVATLNERLTNAAVSNPFVRNDRLSAIIQQAGKDFPVLTLESPELGTSRLTLAQKAADAYVEGQRKITQFVMTHGDPAAAFEATFGKAPLGEVSMKVKPGLLEFTIDDATAPLLDSREFAGLHFAPRKNAVDLNQTDFPVNVYKTGMSDLDHEMQHAFFDYAREAEAKTLRSRSVALDRESQIISDRNSTFKSLLNDPDHKKLVEKGTYQKIQAHTYADQPIRNEILAHIIDTRSVAAYDDLKPYLIKTLREDYVPGYESQFRLGYGIASEGDVAVAKYFTPAVDAAITDGLGAVDTLITKGFSPPQIVDILTPLTSTREWQIAAALKDAKTTAVAQPPAAVSVPQWYSDWGAFVREAELSGLSEIQPFRTPGPTPIENMVPVIPQKQVPASVPSTIVAPVPVAVSAPVVSIPVTSAPTEISRSQLEVLAGRALTDAEAAELGYTGNTTLPEAISREQLEVLTGTKFTDAEFNALIGRNSLPASTAVTPGVWTQMSNWLFGRTTPAVTPTASVTPTTPEPTPSATTQTPTPTVAPVVTPPVPGTPIISPQPPAAQPTVWSDTKLAGRLLRGVALPASTATRNVAVNVVTGSTASLTGPFMPVVWPMLNVGYRSVFNPAYRADVLALMGRARGPVQTTDTLVPATVTPTPVATSVSAPTEISQGQLEVLAGRALTEAEAAELGYTTNATLPGAISREQLEVLTGTTFTDAEFRALVGGGGTTPPIVPPTGGGGGSGSSGPGSSGPVEWTKYKKTIGVALGLGTLFVFGINNTPDAVSPKNQNPPGKAPASNTPVPPAPVKKDPIVPPPGGAKPCGPNDTYASSGCYPPYVAPGTRGPGNSDVPSPTNQKEKGGLGNSLGQALSGLIGALSKLFGGSQAPQTTPTTPPTTQPTNPPVVTPTPPKPYVTLIANPTSLLSGRKSLLTWSSVNTSSCELFAPGDISMATGTRGSTSTLALATSTLFRLDCSAPSGATTSAKATVTVQ